MKENARVMFEVGDFDSRKEEMLSSFKDFLGMGVRMKIFGNRKGLF